MSAKSALPEQPQAEAPEVGRLYGRPVGAYVAELRLLSVDRTEDGGFLVCEGNAAVGSRSLEHRTFATREQALDYARQVDSARQAEGFLVLGATARGQWALPWTRPEQGLKQPDRAARPIGNRQDERRRQERGNRSR